jgi:hypothetical protein
VILAKEEMVLQCMNDGELKLVDLRNGNECGKHYGNENLKVTIPSTDQDSSQTTGECRILQQSE